MGIMATEIEKEKKPLKRVEKAVRKALEKGFSEEHIRKAFDSALEGSADKVAAPDEDEDKGTKVAPTPAKKKAAPAKKAKKVAAKSK
jgi:hypothetical protein